MKKFLVLVLVLVLATAASMGLSAFFSPLYENSVSISYTPDRPNFKDIDMITNLKVPSNKQDKIDLAYELYKLANKNDQEVDGRMYYSFCLTDNIAIGTSQKIDLYIFNIKDGDEFFRIDYRVKNSVPLLDIPGFSSLNNMLELITTERQYYSPKLGKNMYYEKVRNATLDKKKNIPTADWTVKKLFKEKRDVPFYTANQEIKYEKCDHTINTNTIKAAEIIKTTDGVKVKVELDCEIEETTEKTKPLIEKGANDKNAAYTTIIVEFELWANGYYKTYKQSDAWGAKTFLDLEVSSTFEYTDVYVYDREVFRLDKWADAKDIRETCKNGMPKI